MAYNVGISSFRYYYLVSERQEVVVEKKGGQKVVQGVKRLKVKIGKRAVNKGGRWTGFGMRHTTSYLQKFLTLRLGLCLLSIIRRQ